MSDICIVVEMKLINVKCNIKKDLETECNSITHAHASCVMPLITFTCMVYIIHISIISRTACWYREHLKSYRLRIYVRIYRYQFMNNLHFIAVDIKEKSWRWFYIHIQTEVKHMMTNDICSHSVNLQLNFSSVDRPREIPNVT